MKTFLYVKTHNVTGLKYFGKTCRDPYSYGGSGVRWKRHLAKHGNDVTTKVIGEFEDLTLLTQFALSFSKANNIVASNEWANLIDENGLDGKPFGSKGHSFTPEEREKISKSTVKMWEERRPEMLEAQRKSWTEERKKKRTEYLVSSWTEEKRANHSAKMKENWANPEFKARAFDISKVPNTPEQNRKISIAHKGKKKSESHKAALAVSARRRVPSKMPVGVTYLESGKYLCHGVKIDRITRTRWEATIDGELIHGSLSGVASAINNKFLIKNDR